MFSAAEQEAVAQFHNVWIVVAANTPDPLPDLESLFATAEWHRLRAAALLALQVFLARAASYPRTGSMAVSLSEHPPTE